MTLIIKFVPKSKVFSRPKPTEETRSNNLAISLTDFMRFHRKLMHINRRLKVPNITYWGSQTRTRPLFVCCPKGKRGVAWPTSSLPVGHRSGFSHIYRSMRGLRSLWGARCRGLSRWKCWRALTNKTLKSRCNSPTCRGIRRKTY